jgi:GTP-binding protein LepA
MQNILLPYITGFEDVKPMVLLEFYPVDTEDYELRNSMEKLQLNDASLVFLPKVRRH